MKLLLLPVVVLIHIWIVVNVRWRCATEGCARARGTEKLEGDGGRIPEPRDNGENGVRDWDSEDERGTAVSTQ